MFTIFNIPIMNLTIPEVEARLRDFLMADGGRQVVTINPEFLVAARKDPEFTSILTGADLQTIDGFGLKLVGDLSGETCTRITGTDLLHSLSAIASEQNKRIMFLGGKNPDVGQRAADKIRMKYPQANIVTIYGGLIRKNSQSEWEMPSDLLDQIRAQAPDILFVALGQKKQEKWIHDHLSQLPSVKIAVGIGGVLDVLAGEIRESPAWMRRVGMEWLWRLIQEPRRFKRIVTAVIVFPVLCIYDRMKKI